MKTLALVIMVVACGDTETYCVVEDEAASTCTGDAASISTERDIEGYGSSMLRYAVYGAADVSRVLDDERADERYTVLLIIAADHPDFCDEVVDGFHGGTVLTAIDKSVPGTFFETIIITPLGTTSEDVTLRGDEGNAMVLDRFSVSDGSDLRAVRLDIRDLSFTTSASVALEHIACGQPLDARIDTALVDGISIGVDLDTDTISSTPTGEDNPLHADLCAVPECRRLTEAIRSLGQRETSAAPRAN